MMNPREIVEAFDQAVRARDEASMQYLLDPDVVWAHSTGMPGPHLWRGSRDVIDYLLYQLPQQFEDSATVVEEYICDGQTVVALGYYSGVHPVTRRKLHALFSHVFRVEEGRIMAFQQYTDTLQFVRAAQPKADEDLEP